MRMRNSFNAHKQIISRVPRTIFSGKLQAHKLASDFARATEWTNLPRVPSFVETNLIVFFL